MSSELVGTEALVRLAARRDRWLLPVSVLGFAAIAAFSAAATVGLYPDEAQRITAADTVNATPAIVALYGPIYDPTSLGELSMFKLTSLFAAMISILMVVLVVRHTRAEEEAGRLELVGSGVVGRGAPSRPRWSRSWVPASPSGSSRRSASCWPGCRWPARWRSGRRGG